MPAETLRERWCATPKSKLTSPEIPKVLASWLKVCATSAFLSSALDGIQPTFKHTPPQYCFSTTATFLPSCASRKVDMLPLEPATLHTTSTCSLIKPIRVHHVYFL